MGQLEQLVSGDLDDALAERIVLHLDDCVLCSAELDRIEQVELAPLRTAFGLSTVVNAPSANEALAAEASGRLAIEGYHFVEEIARGGQGVVCLAIHEDSARKVAIKLLHGGGAASHRQLRRFEREIEVARQLQHPCIVEILDFGAVGDMPYYVMEYIDGLPLTEYVEHHDASRHARMELLTRVCEAVGYAHEHGVIHRDLKPRNILVEENGHPQLIDFGLIKASNAPGGAQWTPLTAGGEFLGTKAYAAPEQSWGEPDSITPATDVHSLGVLMYELIAHALPKPDLNAELVMLTDRLPLPAGSTVEPLSGPLADVLHRALEPEPQDRFPDASAMARSLAAAL